MTIFLETIERKYNSLDTFYTSLNTPGKLLFLSGVAVVLLAIGSAVIPTIYKSGEEFGAYVYNNFNSN